MLTQAIRFGTTDYSICLMISVKGAEMGGFGSGRFKYGHAKKHTRKCPWLDVRQLHEKLRPGQAFPYSWTCNDRAAGAVDVTTDPTCIVLSYCYRDSRGELKRVDQTVGLEWSPCYYGGCRPWFLCPERTCGRRVAVVYCQGCPGSDLRFACRHCHNLAYASQGLPAHLRALRRAQAIRQRLGGTANMHEPFPGVPKGMHLRTYDRLRRLHDDADAHSWYPWLVHRVEKLGERCAKENAPSD